MDSYPSNSNKNKEPFEEPKVVIEPVVTGTVTIKSRSWGRRFKDTFVRSDLRSIGTYVAWEILIPSARDIVSDIVDGAKDRVLYGDEYRRGSSSRRARSTGVPGHINYGGYAKPSTASRYGRDEPRRELSRVARAQHNFDEIILDTRIEAETVIERLGDLIDQYQVAKVSDLYDLCGITGEFTDEKYGWYDMIGARVDRVRGGGYLLNLPRPEVLRD